MTLDVKVFEHGFEVRSGRETLRVEAWGLDSARVRAAIHRLDKTLPQALMDAPARADDVDVAVSTSTAVLTVGQLVVTAELVGEELSPVVTLRFEKLLSTGKRERVLLLEEVREHFSATGARIFVGNRAGSYQIRQNFRAHDGERFFGLGQHGHGKLDQKGLSLALRQRNGEVNIPFVVSDRGYGMLWNTPALGEVSLANDVTCWRADQARQIDYWITTGDDPAQILSHYADATGHSPELPSWASGFWQSKLRYRTQEELLNVAHEYAARDLPLSVIVCDYFHWTAMGDFEFDATEWPDPTQMVEELKALNVELMVSVWPTVSPLSKHFSAFSSKGLLLSTDQGVGMHRLIKDRGASHALPVTYYDSTNPETRQFVWDLIRRNYVSHGIHIWWLDASEPELLPDDPGNLSLYAGPGAEVSNLYPLENARLFAEGMSGDHLGTTVLLSRSAWAGAQKYGVALWSGDIDATWESFRTQISAGLNVGMSGIPWWTSDIGGFNGGDPADESYRELIVRWFQFGLFCPLFRLHGDREPRLPPGFDQTGGPNEVWSYGTEAYSILGKILRRREKLRPYIHQQMNIASSSGLPVMRPLFIDYPNDSRCWDVSDQYLFGPDLLVAPITELGARKRAVYLPEGSQWVDLHSGKRHDGGTSPIMEAPLDHIPVFARVGGDFENEVWS